MVNTAAASFRTHFSGFFGPFTTSALLADQTNYVALQAESGSRNQRFSLRNTDQLVHKGLALVGSESLFSGRETHIAGAIWPLRK
jgi:hypothetical protein